VTEIFNSKLQPRIFAELNTIANRITLDARRNHTFKNRTGALQESIAWEGPDKKGDTWYLTIFAGGRSVIKYAFNFSKRGRAMLAARTKGEIRGARRGTWGYRNILYGPRWYGPEKACAGMAVDVGYARFVENNGFSVLRNAVAKYKPQIGALIARSLRAMRLS
jgi:hypothetical protein